MACLRMEAGRGMMSHWKFLKVWRLRLTRLRGEESGQDMIEYALITAALVVIVAAFIPVQVAPAINVVFTRVLNVMNAI
jgi:Flp pilus assembly pilin Flp